MKYWMSLLLLMSISGGCGSDSGQDEQNLDRVTQSDQREDRTEARTESGPTGTLAGRITVGGEIQIARPLVKRGDSVRDAEYCARDVIPDESLLISKEGGLANCFVYLRDRPDGWVSGGSRLEPLVQDQVNCQFTPRAAVVQTEQLVRVINSDPIIHNAHVLTFANQLFNRILKADDTTGLELTYERPERIPVQITCDIHPWMRAWHLPLDHPFAAVTAPDGTFRIEGIPVGRHRVRVWHERVGYLERTLELEIVADKDTTWNKVYDAERFPIDQANRLEQ